jgi:hypothetical protein
MQRFGLYAEDDREHGMFRRSSHDMWKLDVGVRSVDRVEFGIASI